MEHLKLLRINHWVKNLFIFIPVFFAGEFFNFQKLPSLIIGFLAFSLTASSIYIINDYKDIGSDKLHPKKRFRPLASGVISPKTGLFIFFLCAFFGVGLAYLLKIKFFFILSIYFVINIGYSFGLKKISILDVIIVAIGFVLRVKAGGTLGMVHVSHWLVLMIFLLALFMAFAKRRDDVLIKLESGKDMRASAKSYNLLFINSCLIMIASISIVSYIMYTISDDIVNRFNSHRLYYTGLFVFAGIFRYMQITFVENESGSPTGILYKDRFIQVSIILWILSFYFIIYYPNIFSKWYK